MSLIKQLWLAIIALLLLSFVGSLAISITSSRDYIEQEVRIKNEDNATTLALSMSQLDKDLVILELLISAQFDTGYYRSIILRDAEGEILVERSAGEYSGDVPAWFRSLVQFDVPTGTATIQDGWRQFGTLELESQHSYAYASLWRSMLELAGWFLLAGAISLAIATVLVRGIKHPLVRVVAQAKDISARRFTTIQEPRTLELREVAQAMNVLSANVRQMLSQESQKLDELRCELQHDRVTGALNRDVLMSRLASLLGSDDARATGLMVMVRVQALEHLNDQLGHQATDQLLSTLVKALATLETSADEALIGRLNGSDFLLMLPLEEQPDSLLPRLQQALATVTASAPQADVRLATAIVAYHSDDERGPLLATLDDALAEAESGSSSTNIALRQREQGSLFGNHNEWRTALTVAIEQGPQLAYFPVIDAQNQVLHYECPARLELANAWQTAGLFIPWVTRFALEPTLDMAVVKKALGQLEANPDQRIGVNLSIASINNAQFVTELRLLLEKQPALASKLCFEVPATLTAHSFGSLRGLCSALRPLGCQFGIEHVGAEFTKLADLHDVGLAYLKVDSSLIRGIHVSNEQQTIVRGMATLCHSLGIQVIAEGVIDSEELQSLFRTGVDGATGPGVRLS
ncbi:EAL domain-containing protein [Vreelandella aquamarina]|uniref:EAL domain-containing protein n=1 Tax=Halomonadaceae TaxID=28256 RepID=UPI001F1880FF|nr:MULTISPECIES: EAL domain-containing protein [unclassified Halomonas]MCF2913986.1 EAL domain-containing protein [Halomonas sp. Cn5-12]MCP1305387.1 EAL domain-containing protein [Halomonas sp. R1t8]MCP1331830.1 EAL domain-containing protein [Halomonas sp. R1t4]